MKAKLLDDQEEKTYVLVFDKGDEAMAGLLDFASIHAVTAARFTAIGAFSEVTLGYFDRASLEYKKIPVNEQVEVLSLIGDIALDGEQPKVHAHVVVGCSDGSTRGGHLIEARVWPTLEVMLEESPKRLQRRMDKATGLALISL